MNGRGAVQANAESLICTAIPGWQEGPGGQSAGTVVKAWFTPIFWMVNVSGSERRSGPVISRWHIEAE